MAFTSSQINKLGERLRTAEQLDEALLRSLQDLRAEYQKPMLDAQARIRDALGIDPTARLKTVNTLVEKLKRAKTRLSKMQDLAGLRIVDGDWRADQDLVVGQLVELFGAENVTVDDLRAKPSHGYRAVHVIVAMSGHPVEIRYGRDSRICGPKRMNAWPITSDARSDTVRCPRANAASPCNTCVSWPKRYTTSKR